MEESADVRLLNNICDSLRSDDVETIISTGQFLETVVVHDFPANVFLLSRELIIGLLNLCKHSDKEVSAVAFSCLDAISKNVVAHQIRKSDPAWRTSKEILFSRDRGDGIEDETLLLCTLACTIAEKCKQMIIESEIPFDKIYNLFVSATNILLISRSPSECLNFCDVLSDTLTVLRAGCRRHFISILLLFCKCLEVCPPSLLVDDIVNEAFQSLLDASFIHHYPQLVAVLSPVLKNDTVLEGKYESSVSFYRHFYLLAKALKSPDKNINLMPLLHLMELDESMALALCPYVFKKIKIFGCSHEALLHLLRTQPPTVLDQVYQHLTEFISPLKTTNIDPMMADLLVDESVIDAVKDHLHCDDAEVALKAEKLLTLLLKGKSWMTDAQWQKMMNPIAGKLLLDIEEDMSPCETQRIHVLASNMWDLIYQSILPAEDDRSTSLLDLNVALKFLIRNLSSENVSKRDKCSSFLVAALCQQPRSNQMRPRIAMLDPDLLNRLFEAQVNMIMNSAAEFAESTVLEIIKRLTDMDVPNCLPYLMELAIVLEDNKLHEIFLHSDGLAILIKLLHNALKTAEDSNVEECNDSALASIVSSLLNLASGNLSVQRQLAADNVVLLNIVRASMLTSNALIARRHCAALLHLLSQATGRRFVPSFNFERAPADWAELWSKSLVRTSAKFVFNAQYTSTPGGHIPAFMKLTDEQLEQVKGANDFLLIKEAVNTVTNARSHEDVHSALAVLREVLDRPGLHITRPMLNLKWREAFETFFRVMPESAADEDVFIDILDTFSLCLRRSVHSFDNINDIALFQWLLYIVTNERHVFWVLFQDKCQSHNRGGSSERLWPRLLRFVSSAVRLLYVHPSTAVEGNGSLMHILRILYKSFEQDDQSQVYELNTLKTILDVLTHSTAALLKLRIHGTKTEQAESEDFTTVVTSLLQHVTQTVVSFSTSSKSSSNKGRSIVRSCSQLIGHLMALLPKRCDSLAYQDLDWLVRLLQYPDPVVKTAALEMLNQISFLPQVFEHVADVFDLLKDQDESCSVLQQAALVASLHPKRVTEEALFNACRLLSNSGLWINQNLAQSLCLVLANVIHSDVDPTHLQTIVNEAVPSLPTILTAGDSSRPEVKAVAFNILVRVASFHSNVAVWLLKQIECISVAIQSLTFQVTSLKDESRLELISQSAVFLGFLLHLEADRTFRVAHLLVNAAPDLWWNLLPLVYQLELDNRLSIHVFIMLKVLLMTVLKADLVGKLNWQPAEMERFCQWILPKLPAKMNDPLSQQCLQLLGLFLLCCRPTLPVEPVKEICKFIVTELKHPTLNERSLIVLLELAHRLLSTHEKAESIILQQGIPLIDIWGRAKKSASVLKALIRLEKLLAVREPYKDVVRQLLKLMIDQMEDKESLVVRQLTPIDDDDWTLIETTYDLLVVAASSLEGRRLLVKCRCWNDIAEQWHPVYLKRIRGKQQQWVHAALVTLRAKLLSILTYYSEPTLPELLNGKVIQTLMDVSVCATSSAQKHALSVLRNMSFQAFYRSAVLSTGCVPHMVRFLTSSTGAAEDEFNVRTAVISLMALASNNQRIKCEVRSLADNWFQRNIPPASEIDVDPETTAHLFQRLRRLIDE